jgi:TatD DNase family protein
MEASEIDCVKESNINSAVYLTDSHCHLNVGKFTNFLKSSEDASFYEPKEIVRRADAVGVKYILAIGTELSDIDDMRKITAQNENVFRTIGIHPLEAAKHHKNYSLNDITRIMSENFSAGLSEKCIALGEIGLDYYYERDSQKEQQELFELQLELAEKNDFPVCIHSRNAEEDTLVILKNHPKSRGVIHCFTGSGKFAFDTLDLGFYISFSGVITFKKSESLCETVKNIPSDKLLIETDAPFLAPMPYRGKTNESAFTVHTARKLANLRNVSLEKIAEVTSRNFFELFPKATNRRGIDFRT